MLVKELIKLLEKLNQEKEIRIRIRDEEYQDVQDLNVNNIFEVNDYETEGTYFILDYAGK